MITSTFMLNQATLQIPYKANWPDLVELVFLLEIRNHEPNPFLQCERQQLNYENNTNIKLLLSP